MTETATAERTVTIFYEGSVDPCDEFSWYVSGLLKDESIYDAEEMVVPEVLLPAINSVARAVRHGWSSNYWFSCSIHEDDYKRDGLDLTRKQKWPADHVARYKDRLREMGYKKLDFVDMTYHWEIPTLP